MSYVQQPIPVPKKQDQFPVVPFKMPPPGVPVGPTGEWNPADVASAVPPPGVVMPAPQPQVAQLAPEAPAATLSFPDLPGPETGEFSKGLSAAWQGFKGGVGGAVEAAGAGAEALGVPGAEAVKEYGKGVYQKAAAPVPAMVPKVASLGEVKLGEPGGWGRLKDWSEYNLGQGLGSLGLLAAGGAAGAVVGAPAAVGMAAGAGITALGSEFGKLTEEEVPTGKALPASVGMGAINGALMATPWGAATRWLGLGAKEAAAGIAETIAKDSALSSKAVELAGKVLKGGTAGATVGGGITGLSELVNLAGERWAHDNPVFGQLTDEDWTRFKEAAAGGGLTGLAAGGVLGPFEGAGKKAPVKEAAPEQLAPEQAAAKAQEEAGWEQVRAAQGREPDTKVTGSLGVGAEAAAQGTPEAGAREVTQATLEAERGQATADFNDLRKRVDAGEKVSDEEWKAAQIREAKANVAVWDFRSMKKVTDQPKEAEAVREKFVAGEGLTEEERKAIAGLPSADLPKAPAQLDLFGPERAGLTKEELDQPGVIARARREWAEKGTNSSFFKRWFAGSTVVGKDESPLVVYHGTTAPEDFSVFSMGEPVYTEEGGQRIGSGGDPTTYLGSHFAEEKEVANQFAKGLYGERGGRGEGGRVLPVYLSVKKPWVTTEAEMRGVMERDSYNVPSVEDRLLNYADAEGETEEAVFRKYASDPDFREEINKEALVFEGQQEEPSFELAQEMARQFREDLQEEGYDGIKYRNEVEGGTSYVAFAPEQVKSAVGNRGTFSPESGNIAESPHLSGAKPELEDLGAWAAAGGSASEMLDYLSNQKKLPFESVLGRMLKAAGVGDAKIVLEKDYPVAGRYVAQDHTIHLDSTLSLADMGRTFVHEAVHAATLRAIHLTADSAPVRSLQGIFDHVSRTAMEDFGAGSPLEAALQHGKGMLYGLKDLDEFVSEAFTNQEFQAYLKTIKMPGKKGFIATAWEHFVEALRQALGLKPGDRSALADALEAGTKVMERQARAREFGRTQMEGQSAFLYGGEKAAAPKGGLKEAKERLIEGQDPQLVRQITGWHQGIDGKWRFEIDDSKAKLKTWTEPEYSDEVKELERLGAFRTPAEEKAYERLKLQAENKADWEHKMLPLVLDHPTIFDQYPELKDVVVTKGELSWTGGLYSPSKKEITITPTLSKADALNVILHEIQHWIQFKEDFARGGTPEEPILLLQGVDKLQKRAMRVLGSADSSSDALNEASTILDSIAVFKQVGGGYALLQRTQAMLDTLYKRWRENYTAWKAGEVTKEEANKAQKELERQEKVLKARVASVADQYEDLMYAAYSQLAGEVEARDVQRRQYYSEGLRERVPPGRDVDVRPEEQLIRLEEQPLRGEPTPGLAGQAIHRINEDLAAQTKWLTDEAIKAGYKDPGELFTYEPNKFVELAAKWREEHPEEDGFLPSPALEKFSVARTLEKKLGVMDRVHEAQEGFLSSRFDRLGFFNQAYLDLVDKFGGLTKELKDDSPEFVALKQAVASRMDQAQAQRAEAIQEVKTRYEKPLLEKFHEYKDLDQEKVGLQYAARHIVEDGINKALAERNALEYVNELVPRLGEADAKEAEARKGKIIKAKTKQDLAEADANRLLDWELETPLTRDARQKLMKELMDEFVQKETVKEGTSPLETLRHEWEEFKDHASGLSTGEGSNVHHVPSAAKIYEEAKTDKRLPEIWALLDQANLHALDVRLASGLINKAQYEAMRADKAFYAPLRRAPYVAEEEALNELSGAKGGGKNLRVRAGTHLPGHEPTMVIQNSLAALEATVAAGQANMARRYMAEMIGKLPDEWEQWFRVGLGEEFPYYDKNGFVKHTAPAGMNQKPFDIPFYQDGKLMLIKPVESNSRATSFAAAVMNLNPYRAAGPMKLMQKANSWIRMANVAASPAFLLSNAIKDPLTAALNLQATEAKGFVGSIFREYGASMRALRKAYLQGGLEKAIRDGTEDPDLLKVLAWQKAGGQITHVQALRQMTTTGLTFEKMVSHDRNALRQFGKTVTDFIENANTMMESVMRLSTYSVLTRSKAEGGAGLSPMKASQLSRDVTTNFLRSGFKSSAIGGFYLFFNATVQGNRQVIVNLMKSKRLQGIVAGTVAFSAAVDMLGRAMGAEDQDGDGRNDWDQIPAYEKERNLYFPFRINGDWVKIPAPWVYNVFWRAGQLLSEPFAGVEGKNLPGAFADIARLTGSSMNPVQSGTWAQEASPTVLDPFVQVWENKDFTGRPLSPSPFPGQAQASSWLSFESTPKWAKDLAKWANEKTGGDIARSGLVDIAPANLQVIHDAVGGGITRFGEQVFGAAWDKVNGKETETKDFPVLRQFLTTPGNYVESQLYHERIAQVQAADQALRAYTEGPERNLLKARDVRVESAGLLRMKQPMLDAEKEIKSLRLRARLAESRGDEDGAKVFKDRMNREEQRFNRLWANRVGA